jgi:ABC-2 type transport system ATP-binding protein
VTAAVALRSCSRWYGQVLGVSDITWTVTGRIVGLLGPNGAGKSTLIKLIAGLLRPSRGDCDVFGQSPFARASARRALGYCPEHEGSYDDLTALELVTALARLSGLSAGEAARAARRALADMGMADAQHRRIGGFSKGMRQRTKLAQALAHDPDLILLDEPLTGVDPLARQHIISRVRELGRAGKTVLVSSHILHEIAAITDEILVLHRGQVLAEGHVARIRELVDRHPHRIRVACEAPRRLGQAVASADHVVRLTFEPGAVIVETRQPDACYDLITEVVCDQDIPVASLTSPDNSLEAVFEVLTQERGR